MSKPKLTRTAERAVLLRCLLDEGRTMADVAGVLGLSKSAAGAVATDSRKWRSAIRGPLHKTTMARIEHADYQRVPVEAPREDVLAEFDDWTGVRDQD